ncbi:hypothetical protein PV326_001372 [Microctonus aethiopoides]|nr:hypothetical protein PV326_001372 [Microctonus aethiopoides]
MASLLEIKGLLSRHKASLLRELNTTDLLSVLVKRGVITEVDKDAVGGNADRSIDSDIDLFIDVIGAKGFDAFREFCFALEAECPHVLNDLLVDQHGITGPDYQDHNDERQMHVQQHQLMQQQQQLVNNELKSVSLKKIEEQQQIFSNSNNDHENDGNDVDNDDDDDDDDKDKDEVKVNTIGTVMRQSISTLNVSQQDDTKSLDLKSNQDSESFIKECALRKVYKCISVKKLIRVEMYGASRECHEHDDVNDVDDDETDVDTESYDNCHKIPTALGYFVPINTVYFVETSQTNPYLCDNYSNSISTPTKPENIIRSSRK